MHWSSLSVCSEFRSTLCTCRWIDPNSGGQGFPMLMFVSTCFGLSKFLEHKTTTRGPTAFYRSPDNHQQTVLSVHVNKPNHYLSILPTCFFPHVLKSLLCILFVTVTFQSFGEGTPHWPILAPPWIPPGRISPKSLQIGEGPSVLHPYQVSLTSIKRFCSKGWLCVQIHIHALLQPLPPPLIRAPPLGGCHIIITLSVCLSVHLSVRQQTLTLCITFLP